MNYRTLLVTVITLFLLPTLKAQDIHFTQFNLSPVTLNPANTGAFYGTVRLGGIYRDQWGGLYRTPAFQADAPIISVRKNDWVGVGMMFLSDQTGDITEFSTSMSMLSGAYHLALDKKATSTLSLGVQVGNVGRKFSFFDAILEDEIDVAYGGGGSNISADKPGSGAVQDPNDGDLNTNYIDYNVGLLYKSLLGKTNSMELGLVFAHLTGPNYSLVDAQASGVGTGGGTGGGTGTNNNRTPKVRRRPFRTTAHGTLNVGLTDNLSLSPSFIFQTTGGAMELAIQGLAGLMIRPEDNIKANAGLGYRVGDAGQILLGMDYKDLRVGLAYDLTLSSQTEIEAVRSNAFELGATYIIKLYKKPEVKPAILCPEL